MIGNEEAALAAAAPTALLFQKARLLTDGGELH